MSQGRGSLALAAAPISTPPLGPVATLAWGAVGVLATFSYLLMGKVVGWTGAVAPLPKLADLLPLSHILLALTVVVAIAAARKPVLAYLAVTRPGARGVLGAMGLGILGYVMLGALYFALSRLKAALGAESVQALPATLTGAQAEFGTAAVLISLWAGMVVAAPIAEEMFYRGFLYRGLAATRLGAAGAIVLTSVLFGLCHAPGFGWERVVGTGLIGVLLGILRWRTDNLVVPIVAHATMNLLGATMITLVLLAA
ncbi:MAG: type II CAAX endopeptidase family protein [Hyphomicrobiaceae bacterium]